MLRIKEKGLKAKTYDTVIVIFDDKGTFVRTVAEAKMDGFAEEADLPEGGEASSFAIMPIHIPGVETPWTEGDGETTFIWDCRNENGGRVKAGTYRIEIGQSDAAGHTNVLTRYVRVIDIKAA